MMKKNNKRMNLSVKMNKSSTKNTWYTQNFSSMLTTTITKGTREKLLPNLEDTSTENSFLLRKQQISTAIPVNHWRISCNLNPNVHKPCTYLSIVNQMKLTRKFKMPTMGVSLGFNMLLPTSSKLGLGRFNIWHSIKRNVQVLDKETRANTKLIILC